MTKRKKHKRFRSGGVWDGAAKKHTCINCGGLFIAGHGHFIPPSLGEPGFFICKPQEEI